MDIIDDMLDRYDSTDMKPVMRTAEQVLEDETHDAFSQGQASDGTPWPELAESTKKRKGHGIKLIEAEAMLNSLINGSHPDAVREFIQETNHQSFVFGTRDKKAGLHTTGTKKMPARPPVTVPDSYPDDLAELTVDHQAATAAGENHF